MRPEHVNLTQAPHSTRGWYESFYQRANHPVKSWAFWLRYTIFRPSHQPERAMGELWAVWFDGQTGRHVRAKEEFPLAQCDFGRDEFAVRIGTAMLKSGMLKGQAGPIAWDLTYTGSEPPLYLLPPNLYEGGFPKAKSLVGLPLATYDGTMSVDGVTIPVEAWVGSQNHNWGSRHTDSYAFGQVAGFDNAPGAFLELATARTKLGPVWLPRTTLLVLRHNGREYALTSLRQGFRATAHYTDTSWEFQSEDDSVRIQGRISARPEDFVELIYGNPPGGTKLCRNTKIGACELTVTDKATGRSETLTTTNRALFEILA
jgi:hypothetical protein